MTLSSKPLLDPARPDARALTAPATDTLGRVWPAGTEYTPAAPPEAPPGNAQFETVEIDTERVTFATVEVSAPAAARIAELVENPPPRDRLRDAFKRQGDQ